ncbi:MAG: VOC family protein [Chloroflexi bacterium]|nr:VOC family protein [Chloroflexota bacterium]MCI0782520.1 VOC family protein [Chloroflexota bacterium]MCI0786513.1 VOC family protein [Chloroflexota bacterium]MCI0894163.1 VOC family protein [Chloroflexota bacterium]
MVKIKHIAYTTTDPDKMAAFFKESLGMEEVGRGSAGHVYLSDGELNLTIRKCKTGDDVDVGTFGPDYSGIHHIGFVVDNVEECAASMVKAGAKRLTPEGGGRNRGPGPSQAEIKLSGPDGIILDVSETGWLGN